MRAYKQILTREQKQARILLFLIGLFSLTQIRIGGYIGISEFALLLSTPFILSKSLSTFRRDGTQTILLLGFLWFLGAVFADMRNGSPFESYIRGWAVPVCVTSGILIIYPLLKKYPHGLAWFILGVFLSSILSIFVFQPGTSVGRAAVQSGAISAAESIMDYKLFWINRIGQLITLPIKGWYLSVPYIYSIIGTLGMSIFALLEGGRSAFAVYAGSAFILLLGGKNQSRMSNIRKQFPIIVMLIIGIAFAMRGIYRYAAERGIMGETEKIKYEEQTLGGKGGFMQMLRSGRGAFFIAADVALKHPIVGMGSHAIDRHGYVLQYVRKYGSDQSLKLVLDEIALTGGCVISGHSHIICFWLWHGIFGLIFWIYVLYQLTATFFTRLHVVPEFFGYFALTLPTYFWDIFFSPFGNRLNFCMLVCVCLLVRHIADESRKGYYIGRGR